MAVIPEDDWLAVPDLMELTGAPLTVVKAWLAERELVGVRRGPHRAVMVPRSLVTEQGPLKFLRGTISTLADSGFADEEIVEWLHRPDETLLGGSAVASLQGGHKTEVRRRAQETAF